MSVTAKDAKGAMREIIEPFWVNIRDVSENVAKSRSLAYIS